MWNENCLKLKYKKERNIKPKYKKERRGCYRFGQDSFWFGRLGKRKNFNEMGGKERKKERKKE
jgi:hypothetical protein